MDASGKPLVVADGSGDVVLVEFLFTTCSHCQATARLLNRLQKELGPRGLRTIGVAFNDEAEGHPEELRRFVQLNGLDFPVGVAPRDAVIRYLGISVLSRFAVPQILVIDRNGTVRAKSDVMGSEDLVDESKLRTLVDSLLREPKAAPASHRLSSRR